MLGFDFPKCLFHRKFDTKQKPAVWLLGTIYCTAGEKYSSSNSHKTPFRYMSYASLVEKFSNCSSAIFAPIPQTQILFFGF